jgi:LysM repeat protein
MVYAVQAGDTLGGIAERFGVALEALMAANPGVVPTALIVGMELVIPTGSLVPGEQVPTPAALSLRQARCWPESGGGAWCMALLVNDLAEPIENIAAQFTLLSSGGEELGSQAAYAPLNLLPPGGAMPLGVHFPPAVDPEARLQVRLLSATRLMPGDTRYLPVMLENTLVQITPGGRSAEVSGRVMLAVLDGQAETTWVLATAYDTSGNLVGFRRWEAEDPLAGGESLEFAFLVASMGPEIARVEFLAESRP